MNALQVRDEIIVPTLTTLGLVKDSRVNLLLGTCAQESHMGKYRRQISGGPALGIFQIEPTTHELVINWLEKHCVVIWDLIQKIVGKQNPMDALENNDCYSCAIAMSLYYSIHKGLPKADDVEGLAHYWKDYYNRGGAGTIEDFVENYNKLVLPYV
jgi:hypothetical protein